MNLHQKVKIRERISNSRRMKIHVAEFLRVKLFLMSFKPIIEPCTVEYDMGSGFLCSES